MTIGQWLRSVLLVQVLIAVVLLVTDIEARWRFDRWFDQPGPTGPVSPGDQVRRYDPTRPRPQFTNPGNGPEINLPDDLPPRLEFTMQQDAELGALLMMNGAITGGDADRFEAYLADLEDMPDAVALNSPGGIVDEALAVGRLVREASLDTLILPGMACLSSCPYVLAAGVERRVSRTGAVGLHQHYYETPGYMPVFFAVEDIQRGQGETMGYLIEMGVDPGVMVHGLTTPPNDIYVLVESELLESRLATGMSD
ncbi:hypothetical protein [Lacimonas salitolerans]|uniref:Clp protease n=1 Tax=Lacimonas salitolerans TaxID=1323750 RepID=A0ABW4EIN4_9RHOB